MQAMCEDFGRVVVPLRPAVDDRAQLCETLQDLLARLDAAGLAMPAIHVQTALDLLERC